MSLSVTALPQQQQKGHCGALEAAIEAAGLNQEFVADFPLEDHAAPRPHPPEIASPLEIDSTLKPTSSAWGHESFLTQGDILQVLGNSLVTRSDTFVIRAYGESLDRSGKRKACAWCEVIV